jgi:hypothetical protein
VITFVVILFSFAVVTFPGELLEVRLPIWLYLPAFHNWLFNETPDVVSRRRLPFSNTLVLTGLNVYEGLGIDDPEKAKWHDFVFRARGRDLRGAIFDLATLPRVDFVGCRSSERVVRGGAASGCLAPKGATSGSFVQ